MVSDWFTDDVLCLINGIFKALKEKMLQFVLQSLQCKSIGLKI